MIPYHFLDVAVYGPRRSFIQTAQTIVGKAETAAMGEHAASSNVQYTKYGSTFSTLDVVKFVTSQDFDDTSSMDLNPPRTSLNN